jgi:hypothetical protein
MDQLERLGSAHECFSELLYAIDPRILIRIACQAAGIVPDELVDVLARNPRIELPAVSKRAHKHIVDLVFTVQTADGKVIEVWVFEIQLGKDPSKIRRWDVYPVAFGLEYDAEGRLALFVPEPKVRRWIRTKVLPRMKLPPILIEPDQIERITDHEDAQRRPELTILGCLYHVHEPAAFQDRVEVCRAAWLVIQSLAEPKSLRYAVLVMSLTPPAVFEQAIAELREAGELEESHFDEAVSESEREGYTFYRGRREGREAGLSEGREAGLSEGREAGLSEALRRAILDILELRGLAVTATQRERVESCQSLETLERWYAAVKTPAANQTTEELLSADP